VDNFLQIKNPEQKFFASGFFILKLFSFEAGDG
jgi:hypothetical protein